MEKVLKLFEDNEIKNVTELQKIASGAVCWAYNNGVIDELPFKKKCTRKNKKFHDINKVIDYLERWAKEEGTTVQVQAAKYGYAEEYKQMIVEEKNKEKNK